MIINYTTNVAKIFEENLKDVHLSRQKFIIGFISGLIETGSVKFTDIAAILNDDLYQQNQKFDLQNNLITNQNTRLDQQTYLQEAERRGSLVFLFSKICFFII